MAILEKCPVVTTDPMGTIPFIREEKANLFGG
jgi:hypothetical protein